MMKKKSIEVLFGRLCRYFGYDWNEVMKQNSINGTLGDHMVQRSMFTVYKYIQEDKIYLAWDEAVSLLNSVITRTDYTKMLTSQKLREMASFFEDAAGYMDLYQEVKKEDRKEWRTYLQTLFMLTDEEKRIPDLEIQYPRSMSEDALRMIQDKNLIQWYRYAGKDQLHMDEHTRILMADNFVMTDNVADIISRSSDGKGDDIRLFVMLNIDRILNFSYFVVAVNQGTNWWLASDEPQFANPQAKEGVGGRNGGVRYVEHKFDYTVFPYIYLDRIEEWRKENKDIVRQGEFRKEFYQVPFSRWPLRSRICLNLMLTHVFNKLQYGDGDIPEAKFVHQHLDTSRLLASENILEIDPSDMDKSFDFADSSGEIRRFIGNICFKDADNKSLVKVSPEQIRSDLAVWNGSLMTVDSYCRFEAWAVRQRDYLDKKERLFVTDEEIKADGRKMMMMIENNIHNRYDELFAAKELDWFVYDPEAAYVSDRDIWSPKRRVLLFRVHTGYTSWLLRGLIGGTPDSDNCRCCNTYRLKSNHTSVISIPHYAVLAWLAGVEREQLPFALRNYTSDSFRPYIGNRLLNNINPLFSLKDEVSRLYPNGLFASLMLCKRCRTRFGKKAIDNGVLVINAATCKSEGIWSVQDFYDVFLPSKGIHLKRN